MKLSICGPLLVLVGIASQGQAIQHTRQAANRVYYNRQAANRVHHTSQAANRSSRVTVELSIGTVNGRSHRDIDTFSGIPYAEPPTGERRLKPPVRMNHSMGMIDAMGTAPACPQILVNRKLKRKVGKIGTMLLDMPMFKKLNGQEDCLTLSVQRPSNIDPKEPLPVMVWLHGGGFDHGSSNTYDASSLISHAVRGNQPFVFVAPNYRLGAFGFLPGAEVLRDGSANLGLLDQRMALEWVADNIEHFGGDPTRVTVWGQSAGAESVFYQMALYGGGKNFTRKKKVPLFRGAIMSSASMKNVHPVDHPKAQEIYDQVVKNAGCRQAADTLDCLRKVDFEKFQDAAYSLPGYFEGMASGTHSYFPRPDGTVLPNTTESLIKSKKYFALPMIVGNQEDEGTLFSLARGRIRSDDDLVKQASALFPNATEYQLRELLSYYPNETEGSPFRTGDSNSLHRNFKRFAAFVGDVQFDFPRRRFLDLMIGANYDVPLFSYLASYYHGVPYFGTCHGSDIIQVFYGMPPLHAGRSIRKHFINFLYDRHPNIYRYKPDGPNWPEYNDWADIRNHKKMMWFKTLFSNDVMWDTLRASAFERWNNTEAYIMANS